MCIKSIKSDFKGVRATFEESEEKYQYKRELRSENSLAVFDNELIRLPNNATLRANKLIILIISYLDYRKDNRNENGEIWITISNKRINDFISFNGRKNNDDEFKKIAREIITTSIITGTIKGHRIAAPIIAAITENNGEFSFAINRVFYPYLQELQNKYTALNLLEVQQFRSNYTLRLYEFIRSYSQAEPNKGYEELYATIDTLYKVFGLNKTDYRNKSGNIDWYNFEKYCLGRASAELKEKWIMECIYERDSKHNRYLLKVFDAKKSMINAKNWLV